jgi:hypothetical protein
MSDKENLPRGYRVYVDDNFHYMDEDERYCLGEFSTYAESLLAARNIVDAFFHEAKPGQTADELYNGYISFGEDPFIVAFGDAEQPDSHFSAWSYAKHLATERGKIPQGE